MAKVMRKERVRLGLEACDLHALRYRGVQELAWWHCSCDEIAADSGHTAKIMIAKYAGRARQIMPAREERKNANERNGNLIPSVILKETPHFASL